MGETPFLEGDITACCQVQSSDNLLNASESRGEVGGSVIIFV
jgi:hypothetical protein